MNKPYNNEYYLSQLNKFNSKSKIFAKYKEGNKEGIKINGLTLAYKSIFNRIDGYMYKDFREWNDFPTLVENDTFWMSVTPMEIDSHWIPIQLASGRVCVGGLGLGYYLQNIIDKDDVDEIIVYEKNKDIIDLYLENFGENEKVTIINDDILLMKDEYFDFVYVDIYPNLFSFEAVEHMELLTNNNDISVYYFWGMEGYCYAAAISHKQLQLDYIILTYIIMFFEYFEKSSFYRLMEEPYFNDDEVDKFIKIIGK